MEIPGGVRGPSSRQSSNYIRDVPSLPFPINPCSVGFLVLLGRSRESPRQGPEMEIPGGGTWAILETVVEFGTYPPCLFQLTRARRVFWCCWEDPGNRHGRAQKWKSRGGYVGHPRDSRRIRDVPPLPFPINSCSVGFLVLLGRSRGSPRQGPEMEIPGGVHGGTWAILETVVEFGTYPPTFSN